MNCDTLTHTCMHHKLNSVSISITPRQNPHTLLVTSPSAFLLALGGKTELGLEALLTPPGAGFGFSDSFVVLFCGEQEEEQDGR